MTRDEYDRTMSGLKKRLAADEHDLIALIMVYDRNPGLFGDFLSDADKGIVLQLISAISKLTHDSDRVVLNAVLRVVRSQMGPPLRNSSGDLISAVIMGLLRLLLLEAA